MLTMAACLTAAMAKEPVPATQPIVVCTTTHLSGLVETLAGGLYQTETIVPWGMCPGHFELSPRNIEKIRGAVLILGHGTEKFLAVFENDRSRPPLSAVVIPGNWMIPAIQKQAAEQMATILTSKFPKHAALFRANLTAYWKRIDALEAELQPASKKIRALPAVCSTMNADWVAWVGLGVAAEFQRDDDVSLRNLQKVMQQARRARARLVVDNRQSSGKVGKTLARELGLPLVVLGNFPEPDANGRISYETTLKKNVMTVCNYNYPEP
ncbi:MAG: metal ABC transporter substrate-binding protein [Kiritimatiellia bacterium]